MTLGTVALLVVLTALGLVLGTVERRREGQEPVASADIGTGSL